MPISHPRPSAGRVSVGFVSLGCAKNLVDSQVMAERLLAAGIRLAPAPEEADVVIVNTCGFIRSAKEESIAAILRACRLKVDGHCRGVIVAGCLPQRYREELRRSMPEVDAFIGIDSLDRIPALVRQVADGARPVAGIAGAPHRLYEPGDRQVVFTGGPYAYLKIAEGCNHRCSFCAIPAIRGRGRSRRIPHIVREAERLLARGFRELNLISQDVTAYGNDLGDGTSLPRLLRELGAIGGRFWIRLLYAYPSPVLGDVLRTMETVPQLCHYLDVPVQHSHPDVLRMMCRANTARHVASLAAARAAVPDIALRTTCIAGFPGETERHFTHLLDFVRRSRFDHLGCFVFSPEEGTPAMKLPRPVPHRVAAQRRGRIMRAQQAVVAAINTALVGTEAVFLLERPCPGRRAAWIARSARQAPEVDGHTEVSGVPATSRPGDFVRARCTGCAGYDLKAVFVGADRGR